MEPPKLTTEQRLDGYKAFIEGEPVDAWDEASCRWVSYNKMILGYFSPSTLIRRKPTPQSPLDGLRALARQWRNNCTVKRLVGYERSAFENCAAQLEETVNVIEADHPELRPK